MFRDLNNGKSFSIARGLTSQASSFELLPHSDVQTNATLYSLAAKRLKLDKVFPFPLFLLFPSWPTAI